MQLFLGLFANDDTHSWTGAHDLKVSGQFQGGLQLLLGLFSKDEIHIWTGAHDFENVKPISWVVCSCSLVSFSKDDIHSWTGANQLSVPGQAQGGFAAGLRSLLQKMMRILGLVPMT